MITSNILKAFGPFVIASVIERGRSRERCSRRNHEISWKMSQLRHVHVQKQQVDMPFFRQGERLAPVGRQLNRVTRPGENPLQESRGIRSA